jgi:hypothetical protein
MSDKPVAPQAYRRKAHTHLEGDASLLRHDQNRTTPLNQSRKFPKQHNCQRTLPSKMLAQSVSAASMRLISISERPPTLRTLPQRRGTHSGSLQNPLRARSLTKSLGHVLAVKKV